MKKCPFCHEMIEESETLCPFCGTVQDYPQSSIVPSEQENTKSSSQENRSDQEYRMKTSQGAYATIWYAIAKFFSYFIDKFIHPTRHFSRKRQNNRMYGYISIAIATPLAAYATTHLIQALLAQYQLLADISILPSLVTTPNYLLVFFKLLVFYALFYLGFPIISYGVKHIFLKRQHVFHNWVTQYEGMNSLAFLLLIISSFMSLLAPIGLFVGIFFFFVLHLLTFVVTFVTTIIQENNPHHIDSVYLALIGLTVQLLLTMSLLFLLF